MSAPDTKPTTLDEYRSWLQEKLRVRCDSTVESRYKTCVERMLQAALRDPLWQEITSNLQEYDEQYLAATGYELLMNYQAPNLLTKPFASALRKSFRKNVLDNTQWPKEPSAGWVLPDNFHWRLSDLVRTTMVVKYLDGLFFMLARIEEVAKSQHRTCDVHHEAREEGYYAVHVYLTSEASIPSELWEEHVVPFRFEIQLTTQLQDVIRRLTRKFYDGMAAPTDPGHGPAWQWQYASPKFAARYLGHVLHYLEGMIMAVREREDRK